MLRPEKITILRCPYCDSPMKWDAGWQVFSYWFCKNCSKEFEYNAVIEQFTDER